MNQKLLMAVRLLLMKFLNYILGISHFLMPGGVIKRASLLLLFFLVSLTGYGQLALQNFESGIPSSWYQTNNAFGTTQWTSTTDGYNSTGAAFINPTAENIGAGNTAQYYLITPQITVPANGELRFFTKQSSATDNGSIYQIRLSTANQTDINGFTTLLTSWTETQLNPNTPPGYVEKVVSIPGSIAPGINIYVAFVLVNTQTGATPVGDTWFIDNVQLQTAAVCDPVVAANFNATGITTSSAQLTWSHPSASSYEVQVIPSSQPVGTTGTTVTTGSYQPTGLNENTQYSVYIKTNCTNGGVSTWAGPFNFTTSITGTSCSTPIVITGLETQPYIISANLNAYNNPSLVYTTQGSGCLPAGVTGNYLNGNKAFFTFTPTQTGLVNITQTTLTAAAGGTGCFGNGSSGVFVYDSCTNVGISCLAGLATTTAGTPKQINNLYVEAGHTYIIVVSSTLSSTASICFTMKVEFASCAAPASYTYSNLLQNSVSFSWDNVGNLASAWEYIALPFASAAPTASTTGTPTNTNTNNPVTGLLAGTKYNLYVRSVCGGVPGNWGAAYTFTTQCDVFPIPYTTAFTGASATAPTACWTSVDVNKDGLTWSYLSSYATIQTNTYQNYNNDMLVSPQINLTGVHRLRYKHQVVGGVSSYSIKISTTGIGPNNFTTVLMPETVITNTTMVEKIINIPPGITGPVNIAFVVTPGTGQTATRISIDDVFVEDKPACPDPLTPTAGSITTNSAQLTWVTGDTETQWQVVVQPAGSGVPTTSPAPVSSTTYTAGSLNHSTQYEYYVRAYCSATQQSNWVGPVAFTTLCGTFTVPYLETFNPGDVINSHKSCWAVLDANADGTQWQVPATGTAATIQGNQFWGTPSYDDWIISPAILVEGTKELKFKYKAAFSFFYPNPRFGVQVLMSTTDTNPASFTEIMPLMEFTNTDFLEKSIYINANGPVYIAFRVPPAFSTTGGTSIFNLDDVSIDEAPSCPNPSALTASNITKNTAVVSWAAGFQEDNWEVKVQEAGTGVPATNGQAVTSPTYNAASLNPNTQYEYYVRAVCSDDDKSEWVGPFTFITLCNSYAAPFFESFDSTSATEECWRVVNGNSDSYTFNMNMTTNPYQGDQAAGMFTGSNGNNDDWLISPTITVAAGQRLRYQYRVYDSFFVEDLEVKLSVNGVELDQFTTMLYTTDTDPVDLNNMTFKEKVINLPAGVTGDINIAWHIPQKTPSPAGYLGQILVIDNVIIENIPACPNPTNLAVSNVNDVQAQISWDSTGTETEWEVYVQPAGLPAPVGAGDTQYNHTATASPYTVTGLTPAIAYQYYVRAVCSDTQESEWVGPFDFTTMCSFENLCEYTITLSNDTTFGVGGSIDLIQNGITLNQMEFWSGAWNATPESIDYTVFLCTGVEFSLFWNSVGTAPGQYPGAQVTIKNDQGVVVWSSEMGLGTPRTTMYTGVSLCGSVTCPQPTNLAVNATGNLSWTAGGTETQWEVAIQPMANNTLPQAGTLVSTTSYTPTDADFSQLTAGTYEFFVRAICGTDNKSFWSGPHQFVRNDDASTAIILPVNDGETCEQSASSVSFMGATASTDATTCTGVNNGDIWFEFTAVEKVHLIELSNFSGSYYYAAGGIPQPKITMSLYKVNGTALEQMTCTYNNSILAAYSTELEVGATYKVRLTLTNDAPNDHTFDVCVTTPQDPCNMTSLNYGFEKPDAATGALTNFYTQQVVPGWRGNFTTWDEFFYIDALNAMNIIPYQGGQVIQLLSDGEEDDPTDLVNIKGTYQDFDTSEITKLNYNYAQTTRSVSADNVIQLFAGPPAGPFALIEEHAGTLNWVVQTGSYNVPEGQNTTRFIFRAKNGSIGNVLDAANFIADNTIITLPITLDCSEDLVTLEANGKGTWIADENNPSVALIATPNSSTTEITGFTHSGAYTFRWKTRYCENTIVITSQAIDEVPAVTSPVTYCVGDEAAALTAALNENYSLVWYDQADGGTASTTAPVPSTTTAGTTSYYVAYQNADGCVGQRAQIQVAVNARVDAVTGFTYDAPQYCTAATNPLIMLNPGFTTGGTFTVTPTTGLTIDATTGAITLSTSTPGVYNVTYSVAVSGCTNAGTTTVPVTVNESVTPVTGFTYAEPAYCIAGANAVPSLATGFYTGGTFSAPTGVTINPTTGEIDMANSTPGEYQVTYTVTAAGCVAGGTTVTQVTITALTPAVVNFSYDTPECLNSGTETVPEIAENFTIGGTFSSATLTVDAETGIINITNATAGTHEVTYTIATDAATCTGGGTFTASIELVNGITPVTGFTYNNSYCSDVAVATPELETGFTVGGTFSSTNGLAIDAATGQINVEGSTAGTYEVVYTVEANSATCNTGGISRYSVTILGDLTPVITEDCKDNQLWLHAAAANGSFDSADVTYIWKTDSGATVGSDNPDFNVSEYYAANAGLQLPFGITVTVQSGTCSGEAGYTVLSTACMIPRGISPNGDGDNDSFDLANLNIKEISIFNRYGLEVFHYNSGYTNQWHGQDKNNHDLPDGTYFYTIHKADGSAVTGWVYINREY